MKALSVLSIGYTREMWDAAGDNDTQTRLAHYARHLGHYWLITNSYRRHALPARHTGNISLMPTNAFTPVDSFLRILWMGRKILKSGNVAVIQAQDPILTGLAAVLLGRRFGVPVNVCVYGPNVFDPYWVKSHWSYRFLAPVGKWVLRRAAGVQVDGKLTAHRLGLALGPGVPIFVKPMIPRHFDALLALPPQTARDPGIVRLVFIGRLTAQKNLRMLAETFVRARDELSADGIRLELDILGEGEERESLERRLQAAVRDGSVVFRGQVPGSALADAFVRADALVMTSYYEGYPRVLMEAAAAGLPIATTAISGADEAIVDGKSGFITPIEDRDAFVGSLKKLALDPGLRRSMGTHARGHIREALESAQGHADMQLDIWDRVRAQRGARRGAEGETP
jgi:glycosyltransferase involved in cell wall biosynthesis